MKIGDLVRHKVYREYFGVITFVSEQRVIFYTASDGLPFSTYRRYVEVVCE